MSESQKFIKLADRSECGRATVSAYFTRELKIETLGTLSNRRRRPHDGNRKRDISLEMSLRMYNTL